LQAAWDAGIRHYDTAAAFGAGLAETGWQCLRGQPRDATRSPPRSAGCLHAAPDTLEISQALCTALPFRRTFDYTARHDPLLEDSHQRRGSAASTSLYPRLREDWHGPAWKDRFIEAMTGAARSSLPCASAARFAHGAWG